MDAPQTTATTRRRTRPGLRIGVRPGLGVDPAGRPERHPRTRAAWPVGLIASALAVALVEGLVAAGGLSRRDPVTTSWAFSAAAARGPAARSAVLCLGDSLAKHGLIPSVIASGTGRSSYNLATAAGPAPATYFLFRRAVESGARPVAVVFDLKPGLLAGGPKFRTRAWQELLDPREAVELIRATRSPAFAAELLAGSISPSLRSRHELRANVAGALRGEGSTVRALAALCLRNWSVNLGANLATPRPSYDGRVTEAEHAEHLSQGFHAQRANADYARRLVALAAETGARAYLLIPPFTPELRARRLATGADAGYDAFVRSLQSRHPGLTVLDARDGDYPASVFVDPIHLDARGAVTLSAEVAAAIRPDLDRPRTPATPGRWLRLPPYRPVDRPPGLEDVEQSRAFLAASGRH